MPITLLDGILVGFTLVSAMLAMVRGFSREVLSIASWIAAAIAAFFLWKPVLPYVQPHVDNPQVAMAVAAGAVFVVTLIIVSLITMRLADAIIDSRIGALDRTLGFIYGAARGVLVVAVALLFFNWLVGTKPPTWVAEAKSRPWLESIGTWIESKLPNDPQNAILRRLTPTDTNLQTGEPSTDSTGTTEPNSDTTGPATADPGTAPGTGTSGN